jgi:ribonuclease VapC
MIVVDTSALMAIVLNEPAAPALSQVIERQTESLVISAGTLAETMIVSAGRRRDFEMRALLTELDYTVADVDEAIAKRVGEAYRQWGKGVHPAGLNFGDCFAYALAKERNCPLLFIGNDFSKTDIRAALSVAGE